MTTKYDYIGELLKRLGNDNIGLEQFWNEMAKQKLTNDDVDEWCRVHYERMQTVGANEDA